MSLDDDKLRAMVVLYLEKASVFKNEAKVSKDMCMYPMAANRMYYSLLNAVSALLLIDNHPTHSHDGTKALFGYHYVNTGIMTREEGRLFSKLETMRNRSDYDCYFNATAEMIEELFVPTMNLIEKVERLVKDKLEV